MLRYVILTHDWPFLHWDFLLEDGDKLLAWRLLSEPTAERGIACEALPDHRRVYLDYEGPISGDRGTVTRWDAGTYEPLDGQHHLRLSSSRGFREAQHHETPNGPHWTFR